MNTAVRRILVVGGNGFIGANYDSIYGDLCISFIFLLGSAVCKAALKQGIQVTSVRQVTFNASKTRHGRTDVFCLSSSGLPFRTAKGHSPAWTSNVSCSSQTIPLPFRINSNNR